MKQDNCVMKFYYVVYDFTILDDRQHEIPVFLSVDEDRGTRIVYTEYEQGKPIYFVRATKLG